MPCFRQPAKQEQSLTEKWGRISLDQENESRQSCSARATVLVGCHLCRHTRRTSTKFQRVSFVLASLSLLVGFSWSKLIVVWPKRNAQKKFGRRSKEENQTKDDDDKTSFLLLFWQQQPMRTIFDQRRDQRIESSTNQ